MLLSWYSLKDQGWLYYYGHLQVVRGYLYYLPLPFRHFPHRGGVAMVVSAENVESFSSMRGVAMVVSREIVES